MKEENATNVEISLPRYRSTSTAKGLRDESIERFPATVDKIMDWFKKYQIESIELSISGVVETGTITRLIVSAKGEGGMKVTLKPKQQK